MGNGGSQEVGRDAQMHGLDNFDGIESLGEEKDVDPRGAHRRLWPREARHSHLVATHTTSTAEGSLQTPETPPKPKKPARSIRASPALDDNAILTALISLPNPRVTQASKPSICRQLALPDNHSSAYHRTPTGLIVFQQEGERH
jgi:hypothetical protein